MLGRKTKQTNQITYNFTTTQICAKAQQLTLRETLYLIVGGFPPAAAEREGDCDVIKDVVERRADAGCGVANDDFGHSDEVTSGRKKQERGNVVS